jgi:hypothetical protein
MESKSDPMRDDIESYKSLSKQRDLSLSKAEDKAAIERINKRFNDYTKDLMVQYHESFTRAGRRTRKETD